MATNSANRVSRGLVADVSVEDLYFVTDPEGASIVDLVRKDVKDTDELSSEASSSEQVTLPAKGIIFSPPTTQIFANTHVYEKRLRLHRCDADARRCGVMCPEFLCELFGLFDLHE